MRFTIHIFRDSIGCLTLLSLSRSLIAAYIGNIVGALFVALPAVWFFLGDYNYNADTELATVETGRGTNRLTGTPDSESNNGKGEEFRRA